MPALQILQTYLDEMSDACMKGDWDTYSACVEIPFTFVTQTATQIITSQEELRKGFDAYFAMLKSQHVTDYIRLAESAVDLDKGLISGRYTSHFLAGTHRIIPPFRSSITLRLKGNRWCAAAISNSLTNANWPVQVPKVGPDLPPKGTEE